MTKKAKSKKGPAKRSPKTAAKKATANDARIPLKRIAAELGIEPKAARVKLRRAWRKENEEGAVAFHSKGSRWDLSAAEAKEVRAILGG